MIHHRPQGFDDLHFRTSNLMKTAVVDGSMVLSFRLPVGNGSTGIMPGPTWNASIRIDSRGKIFLTVPYAEKKKDTRTSVAFLIAEQLEVAQDWVQLEPGPPKDAIAAARETPVFGNPEAGRAGMRLLCEGAATVRVMLITAAAERWGVDFRSCHAHEGQVIHTETWRKFGYGQLIKDAGQRPIPSKVELKRPQAETRQGCCI